MCKSYGMALLMGANVAQFQGTSHSLRIPIAG